MANTGFKAWYTLEQYDLSTGIATGVTKPNVSSDPNYYEEEYDTSACPIGPVSTLSMTPSSASYDSFSSGKTATISSNTSWSITSKPSWITITGASGSGNDSFTMTASENTGSPRSGTLTVKTNDLSVSDSISISQAEQSVQCLIAGTKVLLSNGSQLRIEELKPEHELMSLDIIGFEDTNNVDKLYEQRISDFKSTETITMIDKIVMVEVLSTININHGLLEATGEHSQLIKRNGEWLFIPVKDIILGDYIRDIDNNEILVDSIVEINDSKPVYRLTLREPYHIFIANGIVTHNIK